MKETMVFAALVVAAVFILGCDQVTAPTQEKGTTGSLSPFQKKAPDEGVITFRRFLREPLGFGGYVEAYGQLKYTISTMNFADRTSVEIELVIDATFIPYGADHARKWYVSDASKAIIKVGLDKVATIQRIYRIIGRDDGVLFAVTYLTDGSWVKLASMRLVSKVREMPDGGL